MAFDVKTPLNILQIFHSDNYDTKRKKKKKRKRLSADGSINTYVLQKKNQF